MRFNILNASMQVVNTIVCSQEFADANYPSHNVLVVDPAPSTPTYGDKITYFAIKNRFTSAERIAIDNSADTQVIDVKGMLEATASTYTWLNGTPFKNGLLLLVSKGLLTDARRLVIGAFPVTDDRELPSEIRLAYGLTAVPQ